jgi:hypothetical protein
MPEDVISVKNEQLKREKQIFCLVVDGLKLVVSGT